MTKPRMHVGGRRREEGGGGGCDVDGNGGLEQLMEG
jgi:hypothetical protein